MEKCFRGDSLVSEIWNRISGLADVEAEKSSGQWTTDDYTYTFDPSTLNSGDCQRLFHNVFDSYMTNWDNAEVIPESIPEVHSLWKILLYVFLTIIASKVGNILFERLFGPKDPVEEVKEEVKTELKIPKDPIKNSLEMLRRLAGSSGDNPKKNPEASGKNESPKIIPEPIGDFSTQSVASHIQQEGLEGHVPSKDKKEPYLNGPEDTLSNFKMPENPGTSENPATSENPRQSLLQAPKKYPSRFFHPQNLIPVMSVLKKCSSEMLVNSYDQKDLKIPRSPKNFLKINRDRIKSMEQDKDPLWKGRTRENTSHSLGSPGSSGSSKTGRSSKSSKSVDSKFDLD